MAGGGKGGKEKTTISLPPAIEAAAKANLRVADEVAAMGPAFNRGPMVAGFAPQQVAAMQNAGSAANAFGLNSAAGAPPQAAQPSAPQPSRGGKGGQGAAPTQQAAPGWAAGDPLAGLGPVQQAAGGGYGYAPFPGAQQAMNALPLMQRRMLDSFVTNPQTGALPRNPAVPMPQFDPRTNGATAIPAPVRPTMPSRFSPYQVDDYGRPIYRSAFGVGSER